MPHRLKQGILAHVFTDEDRSRGGLARAEKIRAEKAARGEEPRRRRSRRTYGDDRFATAEWRARVQAASPPREPTEAEQAERARQDARNEWDAEQAEIQAERRRSKAHYLR